MMLQQDLQRIYRRRLPQKMGTRKQQAGSTGQQKHHRKGLENPYGPRPGHEPQRHQGKRVVMDASSSNPGSRDLSQRALMTESNLEQLGRGHAKRRRSELGPLEEVNVDHNRIEKMKSTNWRLRVFFRSRGGIVFGLEGNHVAGRTNNLTKTNAFAKKSSTSPPLPTGNIAAPQ